MQKRTLNSVDEHCANIEGMALLELNIASEWSPYDWAGLVTVYDTLMDQSHIK